MSHDIKLCDGALVTYSFVALETKFAGFVIGAAHCYLTLIWRLGFYLCQYFKLWNPNRLALIEQVHDAFITKKL